MGVARLVSGVTGLAALGLAAWVAPLVFDRDARSRLLGRDEERLGPQVPTTARLQAAATALEGHGRVVRRAAVNGVELPYRDEGQGPPLLLIHGHGGGWWMWDPLADELAASHRVVAYSRRGYFGAGAPATRWEQHRRDAAALLEHLDIGGAVVIAHSGAGSVAVELAVERPDLVTGVVLIEAPIYLRRNLTPELVRALLALQLRRALLPDAQAIDGFYRRAAFARDDGSSGWDELPDTLRFGVLHTATAALRDGDMTAFVEPLPPEELAGISCPVAQLIGERSRPVFARNADYVETILPGARRIEVPDADHGTFLVAPAGTAEAIRTAVADMAAAC
jgi:pimeloyl-ACP methyl ester carboxylesterase